MRPNKTNKSMSNIHLDARREAETPIERFDVVGYARTAKNPGPVLYDRENGRFCWFKDHAKIVSEKDKVIEGLRAYAQHKWDCPAVKTYPPPPCTCGLTELLSSLAPTGR